MASRGWKIPGDVKGAPGDAKLECGLKEELKGAQTGSGYRLSVGGPHDIVRVVTMAYRGLQVPMFLEMASPRDHGRPVAPTRAPIRLLDSSPAHPHPPVAPIPQWFPRPPIASSTRPPPVLQLLPRLVAGL